MIDFLALFIGNDSKSLKEQENNLEKNILYFV